MVKISEIITGSNGFIGSCLVDHFVMCGKRVVRLPRELLSNPDQLYYFLKEHQPFRLYYLAAYGNLHGQEDIREMYNVILYKLLNVLEASKDLDCRGIVTTGSTSEYGYKEVPMVEDQVLHPTSFYGGVKAAATHLAQVWALKYDKPVVVFRPASVTGPGEHAIHLIPTIIRSCLHGEPMEFIGEPTHDYIDVEDVVSAIDILGEEAPNCKGEIFNVGTGEQWTNQKVLELIEMIIEKKANITGIKSLKDYEKSGVWIADSSKMRSLGWKPNISLVNSLRRTINYAK